MKLTTAIIVFVSTIANANGKRGIRRALESEQDSYYSMSMPTAVDADAMKGGTSGKAGKEPVGAEMFVGTYYAGELGLGSEAPVFDLTGLNLRKVEEGAVTEITLEGDAVGDFQLLNIESQGEIVDFSAVGLGNRAIIINTGPEEVTTGRKLLDGSIEFEDSIVGLKSISPCVCDSAEYQDPPFDLTEDLTIETKAFFDPLFLGGANSRTSFVCNRLVRQGKGWIGLGINPGRPDNISNDVGGNATFAFPNAAKNAMQGAEAVIGTLEDGDQPQSVLKYKLNGGRPRVVLFPAEKQTLVCPSITYDKKRDETTMIFGKYLLEDDEYELKINKNNTFLYAYGDRELGYHGPDQRGVFTADLPGPGVKSLVTYDILCDGPEEPGKQACPKESYQGVIAAHDD